MNDADIFQSCLTQLSIVFSFAHAFGLNTIWTSGLYLCSSSLLQILFFSTPWNINSGLQHCFPTYLISFIETWIGIRNITYHLQRHTLAKYIATCPTHFMFLFEILSLHLLYHRFKNLKSQKQVVFGSYSQFQIDWNAQQLAHLAHKAIQQLRFYLFK